MRTAFLFYNAPVSHFPILLKCWCMNRYTCTNQHLVGVFVYMKVYLDTYVQVHMHIYVRAYLEADLTWRKKSRG